MHQRFTAGNDGNPAGNFFASFTISETVAQRMGGCIPAFFYITPDATHITAAEPDKISRFSLVITFALDSIKGFHQW